MTRDEAHELIRYLRAIYIDPEPGADVEAWLLAADHEVGTAAVTGFMRTSVAGPTVADLEALAAEIRDMDRLAAEAWAEVERRVRMAGVQLAATGDISERGPIRDQFDAALAAFVDRTRRNMILGPWNEHGRRGNERLATAGISPMFRVFADEELA